MASEARASQGARGEAFIEVDGERLAVLLTNRALSEVEKATGKTVLELARGAENTGMSEAAQLLRAGLEYGRRDARNGGRQVTLDDAWRIMDQLGFVPVVEVVLKALADVLAFRGEKTGEMADGHGLPADQSQSPNG
jgi:hypothetical protein